jgi:glycosyltransferase involved in cell wall biosynthesis
MNLGLAMIVKDEATIIARCLNAVRPLISSWTICDTGSDDETPELIEDLLGGVDGTLHHRPWRSFGENRSELMVLARGTANYLLILNADDEVLASPDFALEPRQLVYMVPIIDGGPTYSDQRIVHGDFPWRYEGVTHEYLTSDLVQAPLGPTIENLVIRHHCDGSRRPRKFQEDEVLLREWVDEHPDDARAVFYLANTLRDLGRHEEAIPLYWRRAQMGGWAAEAEIAARQAIRLQAGDLTALGVPTP